MAKKVKGSAIVTDDGGFLFTPYNTRPPEEHPWSVMTAYSSGVIRQTKNVYQMQITINKKDHPNTAPQEFMRICNILIAQIILKKH